MVLFWRLFGAVLLLFLLVLGGIAYAVSAQQTAEIEQQLVGKVRVLAGTISQELETSYLDHKWPLQDLRNLSGDQDFLFWWVVDADRRIHLADTAAVMGNPVDAIIGDAPRDMAGERLALYRGKGFGVWILPLDSGSRHWSFWVGFSLGRATELKRRIELLAVLGASAALALLGVLVYFTVRHFLKPVEILSTSAEVVGRGDLSHRTSVRSRDELGALADSFNRMVEKLEKTTVSRTYVHGILSSMADTVIVLDPELRIRTVNRSACQLLGEEEAELLGRPFPAVCEWAGESRLAEVLPGAEVTNREAWFHSRAGRRIPVLLSAARMQDGGQESRVVITARDITELNQMKTELAQARDAALASTRHKSEFLANMSHEIRTPMNGIIGMAELLATTALSAEQHDYLDAVHSSAESLLGIINDVLDLSKIEAGKLETEAEPFDLREWFDELLRPLAFRAQQKGLEFAGLLHGTVPARVVADSARLRQVLVNLIGNAIKFTESGEIEVAVSIEDRGAETAGLRFSVRDSGIGIPPEKQKLIFDSFTQADGSISRRYGGSGLGLTISSQLVRLMGGELSVESGHEPGSTFHFTIDVPVHPRTSAPDAPAGRILLVAPAGVSRRALENLLAETGAAVTAAGSGSEALRVARDTGAACFELALVDSALPGAAGIAAELRMAKAVKGQAVLLETHGERQARGRYEVPGVSYRMKPLRRADLAGLADDRKGRGETVLCRVPEGEDGGHDHARTVLVVEDNLVNQRVVRGMLEKRGYRVRLAGSGEEAIAMAATEPVDVVLMDIQMPGLNGIETTAVLRSREAATGSHCPIVALTANAMSGDQEKYLAAGMDDYLSKPLRAEELYRVVGRYTQDRRREPKENVCTPE